MWQAFQPYRYSIILLTALMVGGIIGATIPGLALILKPVGQVFLNLLLMIVVPLVAISVTSSIARMTDLKQLGTLLITILLISILMAMIPAVGMIGLASVFDPTRGVTLVLDQGVATGSGNLDFVSLVTTNDFVGLLSKANILALIVMSVIVGCGYCHWSVR